MTSSPTPEQSARAILNVFKSRNCYAGDPLKISYIKAQFLENHGSEGDYAAGLMYAEDNGWLEITPTRDMQPRDTLTLTNSRWLCTNIGCRGAGTVCQRDAKSTIDVSLPSHGRFAGAQRQKRTSTRPDSVAELT
jgi:hypothetical protein